MEIFNMEEYIYQLLKEKFKYRNLSEEVLKNLSSGVIEITESEKNLSENEKIELILNAVETFVNFDKTFLYEDSQ